MVVNRCVFILVIVAVKTVSRVGGNKDRVSCPSAIVPHVPTNIIMGTITVDFISPCNYSVSVTSEIKLLIVFYILL